MAVKFSEVLAACDRAIRTRNVGDTIAAQVLLSAYVDQIQRKQRADEVGGLSN